MSTGTHSPSCMTLDREYGGNRSLHCGTGDVKETQSSVGSRARRLQVAQCSFFSAGPQALVTKRLQEPVMAFRFDEESFDKSHSALSQALTKRRNAMNGLQNLVLQ